MRLATAVLAVALAVSAHGAASAGWLSRYLGGPQGALASEGVDGRSAALFEAAAAHVRARSDATGANAIAVAATQEGHWRLANRGGEPFTAATPDELKRALAVLLPLIQGKPAVRPAFYLSEHTVFAARARLGELPREADLHVIVGAKAYPLERRGDGGRARLLALVGPKLSVEIGERAAFDEVMWQLARPLATQRIRRLAIEPDGPAALSVEPRLDTTTRKAEVDRIAPAALPRELGRLAGQIALVSGRIEGDRIAYVPASGREGSVALRELAEAAAAGDVGLVLLDTSTPRQPVGRNWLWLKVELKGLDGALATATVGDFLASLAAGGETLIVGGRMEGSHVRLTARPASALAGGGGGVAGKLTELTSRVTGNVATRAVDALLVTADRRMELDARLVPFVPSDWQFAYAGLMLAGLLGLGPIRRWYGAIWPPELPGDFAGRTGYIAAEAARLTVFLALFLPIAAVPGLLAALVGLVRR